MRLGVALSTLRSEVYLEASMPTLAAQTTQMDARVNQMLNRAERQLALKHSWPMQTFEREQTIDADTQFHDFPASPAVTFTMINEVWTLMGSIWIPVEYGIEMQHRSLYGEDARAIPIQRWEFRGDDPTPATKSYEVWPIPGEEQTFRFVCEEQAGQMSLDADTCVLDGDALVQMVAGELLIKNGAKDDGTVKLQNADSIIRSVMSRQKNRKEVSNHNMARRPGAVPRPYLDYMPPES